MTTQAPTPRQGSATSRLLSRLRSLLAVKRIDRYIIGKFLTTYVFLIGVIIFMAIIFDYNEKIDKFTQSHVSASRIIFDYYLNFIPYFSNLFSPLFVFVSVILFTTKLAGNSEIIAMKAAGLSFKRLLRPYMISATIIAIVSFVLGAYIIPQGNVQRVNFENAYIKKKSLTTAEGIQMQVDTGVVAYITHFDNVTKSGYGFSLDKFKDKKLVSHLTAQTIQYDTLSERRYSWTLRMVRIRDIAGMKEHLTTAERLDTMVMMEPSDFFYTKNQQETMTLGELEEFIAKQKMRGAPNISTFEVEYHKRFATPFAAFILTIIGASLSVKKRKSGMGLNLGAGLALSFAYIMFQTVSATMSTNAGLPAAIAVWIPNVVFALIAFALYHRAKD